MLSPHMIYDMVALDQASGPQNRFQLMRRIGSVWPLMIRATTGHSNQDEHPMNSIDPNHILVGLEPVTLQNCPAHLLHGTNSHAKAMAIVNSELKCGGLQNGGHDFNYFSPCPYGVGDTRKGARAADTYGIYWYVRAMLLADIPLFWTTNWRKNPTATIVSPVNTPSCSVFLVMDFSTFRIAWAPRTAYTDPDRNGGTFFPDASQAFVQVTKEKYEKIMNREKEDGKEPLAEEPPPSRNC